MNLIHYTTVVIKLVSDLDCTTGELVVIVTSQDEECLRDVGHVDDESHELSLHVFPGHRIQSFSTLV